MWFLVNEGSPNMTTFRYCCLGYFLEWNPLFSDIDAVMTTFHVLVNTYFLNFRLTVLIILRVLLHLIYLIIFNSDLFSWSDLFSFNLAIAIVCMVWWEGLMRTDGNKCLQFLHFTDHNWIPKTIYCIRCLMVCKIGFTNWNSKIALLCVFLGITDFIPNGGQQTQWYYNVSIPSSRRDK